MRLVVDARQIYRPERRGIGKTMLQLYRTMSERRPDWRFFLIHQLVHRVPELEQLPNVRAVRVDAPGSHRWNLWEEAILPAVAAWHRGDVLHCPANTGPSFSLVPIVLHLHDLIPYELAHDAREAQRWLRSVRRACQRANHILTGSEFSRQRIQQLLGIPAQRISVQAWAADPRMRPNIAQAQAAPVLAKYGLKPGECYFFAFGANDPRKNTRRIVEAYLRLEPSYRQQAKLVIVGLQDPLLSELRQEASSCRQVMLHSFASEADLPQLLGSALALVYASSYEGFGLPILDAFAIGTPVIAGNQTSVPEVAGDAAQLIWPDHGEQLTDAFRRLLQHPDWRDELRQRGFQRIQQYSWDQTADKIAEIFARYRRRPPR